MNKFDDYDTEYHSTKSAHKMGEQPHRLGNGSNKREPTFIKSERTFGSTSKHQHGYSRMANKNHSLAQIVFQ